MYFFTSESVCAGHPDKVCDQISDAIVDEILRNDVHGRVAVETIATRNHLTIAGEVTTTTKINYEQIARREIKRLGYHDEFHDFTYRSPMVIHIHEQSPEIAVGVEKEGAGDQGMMFGFASRETPQLMPLPIILASDLAQRIDEVREKKILSYLRPDGKSQVTVEYKNGKPYRIATVVLAVPHSEKKTLKQVKRDLYQKVVQPVLKKYGFTIKEKDVIVNGTGTWHIGGPARDTGLTGRKIVVDTYGGYARVGGGALSGKDPSKVDRSGAYAARFIAKNIVAAGLADRAEVMLAYVIGRKLPVMQEIETFGTETTQIEKIKTFSKKILDTSVSGIINRFNLRRPLYLQTAAYGHFGKPHFPWEEVVSQT